MSNPQVSRLRTLGLIFCLLGGALITFGWMGTARVACVDCQMPYLLSGGAAGLGLIVIGVGLLVIAQLRAEGDRLAERLSSAVEPPEPDEPTGPSEPTGPVEPADAAADSDQDEPVPARTEDTELLSVPGTGEPDATRDFELPAHRAEP